MTSCRRIRIECIKMINSLLFYANHALQEKVSNLTDFQNVSIQNLYAVLLRCIQWRAKVYSYWQIPPFNPYKIFNEWERKINVLELITCLVYYIFKLKIKRNYVPHFKNINKIKNNSIRTLTCIFKNLNIKRFLLFCPQSFVIFYIFKEVCYTFRQFLYVFFWDIVPLLLYSCQSSLVLFHTQPGFFLKEPTNFLQDWDSGFVLAIYIHT